APPAMGLDTVLPTSTNASAPSASGHSGAIPTGPSSSGLGRSPRAATAAPSTSHRTQPTDSLGDLADLVTRCIELRGDVEEQEVHSHHANNDKETEIARTRLLTKKSHHQANASMLHQELQAAEGELERSKKLLERGFIKKSEVRATEGKIELLSRALR